MRLVLVMRDTDLWYSFHCRSLLYDHLLQIHNAQGNKKDLSNFSFRDTLRYGMTFIRVLMTVYNGAPVTYPAALKGEILCLTYSGQI